MFVLVLVEACNTGTGSTADATSNGRICTATMTASGTFTPNMTPPWPAGYTGCWPQGTWKFSLALVTNDCATAPTLLPNYSFIGQQGLDMNGDPIVDMFTLVTPDPASLQNIVKVSQGGDGICEGEVDLYSNGGKTVFTLTPETYADNSIKGTGAYAEYTTNQWPFGP